MAAITSIPNLGPASQAEFHRAGISTAEDLRALGPDEAYRRLLQAGSRPHFIGYYVIVMGLQGRPWNDCRGEEKKALRERFDSLVAESFDSGRSEIEQFMKDIGLIDRQSLADKRQSKRRP